MRKFKLELIHILILILFTLPSLVFAASFDSLVYKIVSYLNKLVVLLVGIGVLTFLWGVLRYISSGGDQKQTKGARDIIVYGIIGIFVMVSVWGFVNFLVSTIFPDRTILNPVKISPILYPTLPD